MKNLILLALLAVTLQAAQAQNRWFTKEGYVRFYSHTPLEDIEAKNYQVNSLVDFSTGDMAFSMLMKSFQFEKALMEEHFNEKYVESAKFPKSTFEGKYIASSPIDPRKAGEHKVTVRGKLTIHGVTRDVETTGTFKADGKGTVIGTAVFTVKVADYEIKVPGVVKDNIAESIEITVKTEYKPM
jgi:hypothetical protein